MKKTNNYVINFKRSGLLDQIKKAAVKKHVTVRQYIEDAVLNQMTADEVMNKALNAMINKDTKGS